MQKYIVAAVMVSLAGSAGAESYVGVGAGASRFEVDCTGLSRCDKSDTGVKFFGGYRYTPMVAGEVAYIDFGKSKSTGTQDGFLLEGVLKSHALVANLALRLPVMGAVDGVARLGVARVRGSLDQRADGRILASDMRTSLQPYLGLGVQYKLQTNVSLDIGVDMTRVKLSNSAGGSTTSSVRLANAGITFGF